MPGRARLRVTKAHRKSGTLTRAQQALASTPGVRSTEVNPDTGSILIRHDPEQPLGELLERAGLSEEILYEAMPPRLRQHVRGEASHLARSVSDHFYALDARVARLSDGWLDLKMAIPIGLLATAAWRFMAEGAWVEVPPYILLYYTFDTFMKFHQPTLTRPAVDPSHVGRGGEMVPLRETAP